MKLYNTLSRKKEVFKPINSNKVNIYCCGVTVYDLCHIGHARTYLVWDILRRLLIYKGYKVSFVQNFTDIDDKILTKAAIENSSMKIVSEINILEFHKDMETLGILKPDIMPKATECINDIIKMITILEDKGFAYNINGDVYFSVNKNKNYGKLSKRDLVNQKINIDGRITNKEVKNKKYEYDFALWKKAKENEPGFKSPWGMGRPGWHIECSAMAKKELGETIDIHLGGSDLIFPHHENEIAQSECANNKELAKYWLHSGMVNVKGKKMSKSLGNFITIRDLINEGTSPMTLRLFVLQTHYRKPLDFTIDGILSSQKNWLTINNALGINKTLEQFNNWEENIIKANVDKDFIKRIISSNKLLKSNFILALEDDLNTSGALSILFELAIPIRKIINAYERNHNRTITNENKLILILNFNLLKNLCKVLGLRYEKESIDEENNIKESEILNLLNDRSIAKKNKDYKKADSIRDHLKNRGIELIDQPNGETQWIKGH